MHEMYNSDEKIAAIKFEPDKWINETENISHRMIRTDAYKLIDAPKGMNTGTTMPLADAQAALNGYEDIWSVSFDEERNEVRITRK